MPALTYKCPNCGGDLTFDPANQNFACQFCGSKFEENALAEKEPETSENDIIKENQNIDPNDEEHKYGDAALFICPSCGAEIVTDNTTAATQCYYCHNPVVLTGRLDGKFLPNRLVPFKINKKTAVDKFVEWTKKKYFLPKDFFSKDQIEKLTGVYFPYWIIDCDTKSDLTAEGKVIRSWTSGNTRYTKTKEYSLEREGDIHLEDIIKTGLKKANKRLVESVQPFDEQELKPFSMSYLSGFQAEKRDIEQAELENEVNSDIKNFSKQLLLETTSGYSGVTVRNCNTYVEDISWEYGLLPVWTMTYKYNGEQYFYAMNGQTGKTCGKLPVDMKKLIRVASFLSAGLLAILALGGYLI